MLTTVSVVESNISTLIIRVMFVTV